MEPLIHGTARSVLEKGHVLLKLGLQRRREPILCTDVERGMPCVLEFTRIRSLMPPGTSTTGHLSHDLMCVHRHICIQPPRAT